MRDLQKMPEDIRRRNSEFKKLARQIPKYLAGAADKMKDANFAAQGFITNGSAKKWPKRKVETKKTAGKRILHGKGTLQNSVKAHPLADHVKIGVDLGKVPYAKIHNEGGAVIQYIRPHTRNKHQAKGRDRFGRFVSPKNKPGKRYQVKAYARKVRYPKRQYLGFTPDITKSVDREVQYQLDKIMQS